MRIFLLFTCLLLAGCDGASSPAAVNKEPAMDPLNDINERLAFTCRHEVLPAAPADADVLFKYARWLQVNNQLKEDKAVDVEIARLYRIAAAGGHVKAAINLQNGALRGRFRLSGPERLRMSQKLTDAGIGSGYYFIALYLDHGAAGLKQDREMALRYFRKAADEGNAQAQAYVGNRLSPAKMAPNIARAMRRCAAEQGDGEAAKALGNYWAVAGDYRQAVEAFQLGVAAGDETSAYALEQGFRGPAPSDTLYYLGQQKDPERARRYEKIGEVLGNYSYAHPTVPEINDIVPLPPATLPAWDGKLKWLEARKANVQPPKPGEALIAQLAAAAGLNPATGRPLPGSPDFHKGDVAQLLCRSGEPCPRSGYWQIAWRPREGTSREEVLYLRQGDIMPADRVEIYRPRPWPLSDRRIQQEQRVDWRFIGEV
jgi:TPR repeat protein